jgi:hypothetical protein
MSDKKIYFLTFGAPYKLYHDAVNRICFQAKEVNLFHKIYGFTEDKLKEDILFWKNHSNFILNNRRGYGYWIWKPYIILDVLKNINDGDILLWCDSGCEINIEGKDKLIELFEKVNDKLILGTNGGSDDINYTKMDIINYFNYTENNKDILEIQQVQSGCLIMKKCNIIINLITEWFNICSNNYNLIDDSPSKLINFNDFIENRHDQSILSLLIKKYKLVDYSIDPSYNSNYNDFLTIGKKWPIWYCRNRSGIPLTVIINNYITYLLQSNKLNNNPSNVLYCKNNFDVPLTIIYNNYIAKHHIDLII